MTDTPISINDQKAVAQLADLLEKAGAEWATEQQWRSHADRPDLVRNDVYEPVLNQDGTPQIGDDGKPKKAPVDARARGFRVGDLLERGLIVASSGAFHASRNNLVQPAVALYRPA